MGGVSRYWRGCWALLCAAAVVLIAGPVVAADEFVIWSTGPVADVNAVVGEVVGSFDGVVVWVEGYDDPVLGVSVDGGDSFVSADCSGGVCSAAVGSLASIDLRLQGVGGADRVVITGVPVEDSNYWRYGWLFFAIVIVDVFQSVIGRSVRILEEAIR